MELQGIVSSITR